MLTTSTMSGRVAAARAFDFVDSIGVNTHIDFAWSSYSDTQKVINAINYIGVDHLRDSPNSPFVIGENGLWQQVANATGVKFDAFVIGGSTAAMQYNLGLIPILYNQGLIEYIEGSNESDNSFGQSQGNSLNISALFQQQVYSVGKALGVPVINMSYGQGWDKSPLTGNYGTVGDQSAYADYANAHTYSGGNATGQTINNVNYAAQLAANNRPVITTEIGWHTDVNPNTTSDVSDSVQAKYMLSALMNSFNAGNVKSYLYELLDQQNDNDSEHNFGIFNADGTPKIAATALHNLTTLLQDDSASAKNFTSQPLEYSVSGLYSTDKSLLMQKSDGSYWLSVWNETRLSGAISGEDIAVPNHKLILTLTENQGNITVFDPLTGKTAVQSADGARTMEISLPDHPVLIKIDALQPASHIEPVIVTDPPIYEMGYLMIDAPSATNATLNSKMALQGFDIINPWAEYADGKMTLMVSTTRGSLSSTDFAGNPINGTTLRWDGTLEQLNAKIDSLTYNASAITGTATVRIDVWNQGGVMATKNVLVNEQSPYNMNDLKITGTATAATKVSDTLHITDLDITNPWADTANGKLVMVLNSSRGSISMQDANGNSLPGSGSKSITYTGSLSQINAALDTLDYHATGFIGSGIVRVDVWNQGGVMATKNITITEQSAFDKNDLALITPSTLTANIGKSTTFTGLDISNPWANNANGDMVLMVSTSRGNITMVNAQGNTLTSSGNAGIKITGSLTDINKALDTLTYQSTGQAGSGAIRIDVWNQGGVTTNKTIQLTEQLTFDKNDLQLTAPSSSKAVISSSHQLSGLNISNPWAETASGDMTMLLTSTRGSLSALDKNGFVINGNTLQLSGSLTQLNAMLNSLSYNATGTMGSGSVRIDVWNQDGVKASKIINVTQESPYDKNDLKICAPSSDTAMLYSNHHFDGLDIVNPWAAMSPGAMALTVSSTRSSLSMLDNNGNLMTGSTLHLKGTLDQLNAALHSMEYNASGVIGNGSVRIEVWNQAGVMSAKTIIVTQQTPYDKNDISVAAPDMATVDLNSSTEIHGLNIHNPWAGTVYGTMAMIVTTTNGALSMTDALGHSVTGSGTAKLNFSGTLEQMNAALDTLQYQSGGATGAATVRVDVWNQGGVMATDSILINKLNLSGDNTLTSTAGKDQLSGGAGADIFYFAKGTTGIGAKADHILDFSAAQGDTINLHGFGLSAGDFVGNGALTGAQSFGFEVKTDAHQNPYTMIHIDSNGDHVADHDIILSGAHTLSGSEFTFM